MPNASLLLIYLMHHQLTSMIQIHNPTYTSYILCRYVKHWKKFAGLLSAAYVSSLFHLLSVLRAIHTY